MDLEDLRSFVEVVESGGLNRAAERLGISKSMVSRRVARMEADLGTRLLGRTPRGITPTEAGLEFKARCDRILAELEEAREAVAQQGGSVTGRLRLSAPLSFGTRYVAPALTEMARRHPRLEGANRYAILYRIGAVRKPETRARKIVAFVAMLERGETLHD